MDTDEDIVEAADPVPDFLKISEPTRYLVLLSGTGDTCRLIQSPISMHRLLAEAERLGKLSQVKVLVPQNPGGYLNVDPDTTV